MKRIVLSAYLCDRTCLYYFLSLISSINHICERQILNNVSVYYSATQEVVCLVPQSTPEELKEAEKGAYEAFKLWKEVPIQQRQVS